MLAVAAGGRGVAVGSWGSGIMKEYDLKYERIRLLNADIIVNGA